MPIIRPYKNIMPRIHPSAFIAENAVIIGDVEIGAESSVWYGCTLRGDVNNIVIGQRTNIQDHTMIHVSSTTQGTYIGDDVTVGHAAVLHACTIGSLAFIGMQACVMDDVTIGEQAMVAAGALVTPGKIVEKGQLWGGSPAKFMRDLSQKDLDFLPFSAQRYATLAKIYRESTEHEPSSENGR
jgi:carbonic anhydrase/acetyltransferase-like protein (isoleucine patch superfamily)